MADIPKMGPDSQDKAVRFMTMIDDFLREEGEVHLLGCRRPTGLYTDGDGAFEFQRTVSRLMEMQSPEYLTLEHIA